MRASYAVMGDFVRGIVACTREGFRSFSVERCWARVRYISGCILQVEYTNRKYVLPGCGIHSGSTVLNAINRDTGQ